MFTSNVFALKIDIKEVDQKITIPWGAYSSQCVKTNSCYVPQKITISFGDKVVWENLDVTYHTVTSGTPKKGPDGLFDSGLFGRHKTFEHTFSDIHNETYHYYCRIHPWMTGTINIKIEDTFNK